MLHCSHPAVVSQVLWSALADVSRTQKVCYIIARVRDVLHSQLISHCFPNSIRVLSRVFLWQGLDYVHKSHFCVATEVFANLEYMLEARFKQPFYIVLDLMVLNHDWLNWNAHNKCTGAKS